MQRMKHLFFIFSLILVFASSAWSVDLNCPGGTWVQVASCGYGGVRIDGTPSYSYVTRTYSESEWKCPCTGSETKSCYDGPAGTEGVGICRAGTQTCSNGWFGSCQGQGAAPTEN